MTDDYILSLYDIVKTGVLTDLQQEIANGADVDSPHPIDVGQTLLGMAIEKKQWHVAQYLLTLSPDIYARDSKNQSIFERATDGIQDPGAFPVIKSLVEGGVNVNELDVYGNRPILVAAAAGKMDIVDLYLQHDADINAVSAKGRTTLNQVLACVDRVSASEMKRRICHLIYKGADPSIKDSNGRDFYEELIYCGCQSFKPCVDDAVQSLAKFRAGELTARTPIAVRKFRPK